MYKKLKIKFYRLYARLQQELQKLNLLTDELNELKAAEGQQRRRPQARIRRIIFLETKIREQYDLTSEMLAKLTELDAEIND